MHGEIRLEGGKAEFRNNLARRLDGYFVDPRSGYLALTDKAREAIDKAIPLTEVHDDIRQRARIGNRDLGAWETE